MRLVVPFKLVTCTALAILSSTAAEVGAVPVEFNFTGVWRDPFVSSGPVQPGNSFWGSLFYDTELADITFARDGATGQVVDYNLRPGSAGMELHVSTSTGVVSFRSDASAMQAEIMNDFGDGIGIPIDRFYLQSFAAAQFPSEYERPFERFTVDIFDFDLSLVDSTALPTGLNLPLNGLPLILVQGGPSLEFLDFNSAGTITTLTARAAVPEPGTLALLSTGVGGLLAFSWYRRKQ